MTKLHVMHRKLNLKSENKMTVTDPSRYFVSCNGILCCLQLLKYHLNSIINMAQDKTIPCHCNYWLPYSCDPHCSAWASNNSQALLLFRVTEV